MVLNNNLILERLKMKTCMIELIRGINDQFDTIEMTEVDNKDVSEHGLVLRSPLDIALFNVFLSYNGKDKKFNMVITDIKGVKRRELTIRLGDAAIESWFKDIVISNLLEFFTCNNKHIDECNF